MFPTCSTQRAPAVWPTADANCTWTVTLPSSAETVIGAAESMGYSTESSTLLSGPNTKVFGTEVSFRMRSSRSTAPYTLPSDVEEPMPAVLPRSPFVVPFTIVRLLLWLEIKQVTLAAVAAAAGLASQLNWVKSGLP